MIYIDENYPDTALEPSFPSRDVTIKRNADAKSYYDLITEIGRGKFGTVYKCREKSTGLELAAKFVPIPKREDRRNVEREVEIMNSLQHSLIIQLYAAYEYQKMMCVVLELIEGGELFDRVVDDDFVLTERVCTVFMRQICEAMQFIHRNNILHLDLKPENILCITKEGNRIKIIDFGLARKYDPDKKLQILFGTPEFVAPEVVNFDSISFGTDMWSVGVICYVLLSGLSPFMGETDIETMANVTIAKYDFDDEAFSNVSSEALDFISKLLLKDMESRMTASQCLEHKWLERRVKSLPPVSPLPQTTIKQPQIILEPVAPIITSSPTELNNAKESSIEIISKLSPPTKEEIPVEEPSSPQTKKKELLEQTKDNLKTFIERWEEHPNSPYIFDSETNLIAPIHPESTKNSSDVSSRVCSPSPCGSIYSVSEDVNKIKDNNKPLLPTDESLEEKLNNRISVEVTLSPQQNDEQDDEENLKNNKNFKDYLNSFDRRNSDTNYILDRRSSGEKISLAEEIRKLSDHLLMLAEINTKLGKGGNELSLSPSASEKLETIPESNSVTPPPESIKIANDDDDSIVTISPGNQVKYNVKSSTFTKSKSVIDSTNETSTILSSSSITKTKKVSSLSVCLQRSSLDDKISRHVTTSISNGSAETDRFLSARQDRKTKLIDDFKQQLLLSSSSTSSAATTNLGSSVPWPITNKRTKFRINQMSRDVPIGSPDTHQPIDLEDAANNTKDCLLHLLEKYNQKKWRNSGGGPMGRHQSISIDWNVSENLEHQSISSINAFFRKYSSTSGNNYVKQLQAQLESKSSKTSK